MRQTATLTHVEHVRRFAFALLAVLVSAALVAFLWWQSTQPRILSVLSPPVPTVPCATAVPVGQPIPSGCYTGG
jgi:hypothetical protein